jgi:hypothetical protein
MNHHDNITNNQQERCEICGLISRNKTELEEHIKHAHDKKSSDGSLKVNSEEQKIDPFIKNQT